MLFKVSGGVKVYIEEIPLVIRKKGMKKKSIEKERKAITVKLVTKFEPIKRIKNRNIQAGKMKENVGNRRSKIYQAPVPYGTNLLFITRYRYIYRL